MSQREELMTFGGSRLSNWASKLTGKAVLAPQFLWTLPNVLLESQPEDAEIKLQILGAKSADFKAFEGGTICHLCKSNSDCSYE